MREGFDEVHPAKFRRIAAGLTRGDFEEAFDHECRFGAARTAIGIDGRRRRVDAVHLAVNGRNVVLARKQRCVEIRRHGRCEGRKISAEIGFRVGAQRQDLAAGVHGELCRRDVVTTVRVGEEGFRALGDPFHRTADFLGCPDADRLFGIDEDLRAEAAADIRCDHAELVLGRDADEGGEDETRDVRVLARRVERELVLPCIIVANRGTRLHGVRHEPVVDDVELGHVRSFGERRVHRVLVAEVPLVDRVVRRFVVDLRLAGSLRASDIDDGRQLAVVHLNEADGVLGLIERLGDDDGDVVTDIPHLALRQSRMGAGFHG